MKGPNGTRTFGGRFLPIAEWVLLAAVFVLFVVRGCLPAWRTLNTDFPNYYLAASLYRKGIPLDRAYEWTWFQRHKDHLEIPQAVVGFSPHPPMCALPMLPLTVLPPLAAKRVWFLLNLGFLGLALWILRRVTQLSWRRVLLLSFLCVLPLRTNVLYGQYYILILLLICTAYYAASRGHRFTSGAVLAAAASLKLFPALFLILFVRKRDWRAAAGLVTGCMALAVASVIIFGVEVHRVYLVEVLPRALRGDLLGPYELKWNSFTALWHHLFLFEPELNPSPLVDSPSIYAIVQALTVTTLLFLFLLSPSEENTTQTSGWEWAAFVPLLLLLSSMPASYHYCVLIFAAVVGTDRLLETASWRSALALLLLFGLACGPLPGGADRFFLLKRLAATFALYIFLILKTPTSRLFRQRRMSAAAVVVVVVLVFLISNLRVLRDRDQDFSRRLPYVSDGYGAFTPARAGKQVVFVELFSYGFHAVNLRDGTAQAMPSTGDVLSVSGSSQASVIYFELVNQRSHVFRLPVDRPNAVLEYVAEGQQPVVSQDGRWLAFMREDRGRSTVWLSQDGSAPAPANGWQNLQNILEMSVTSEGDIIAAVGGAADPHLVFLKHASGEAQPLGAITGAVRYPAISPDSKQLAFSRRESGSWHLFVRELATGNEQQLSRGSCNAFSPSWDGLQTLLYATDCGRGLSLSTVARVSLRR